MQKHLDRCFSPHCNVAGMDVVNISSSKQKTVHSACNSRSNHLNVLHGWCYVIVRLRSCRVGIIEEAVIVSVNNVNGRYTQGRQVLVKHAG